MGNNWSDSALYQKFIFQGTTNVVSCPSGSRSTWRTRCATCPRRSACRSPGSGSSSWPSPSPGKKKQELLPPVTIKCVKFQIWPLKSLKSRLNFSADFYIYGMYLQVWIFFIQHCFICRPSDSIVSEDAGIEPWTVATLVLAVRRPNHSARSHPPFG